MISKQFYYENTAIHTTTFAAFVCAIFAGCQSADDKMESKYDLNPKDFSVKEVEIPEILKPIDMAFNENYLCFFT